MEFKEETTYYTSPFGVFEIKGSERGISQCQLKPDMAAPRTTTPTSEVLKECVYQLDDYFHRRRKDFDLPLDWGDASDFYKNVWRELQFIPYGQTKSYLYIAHKLGDPNAVRAVGQANGRNPIAIIVPCHRVIAKNGDLQGYFYGLDMKRKLLELENPMSYGEQTSLF